MRTTDEPETCVDAILDRVGRRIRLATPLGLGKPVALLNALYRRAKADATIDLHILTGLTLQRPRAHEELERRFLEPYAQRVWRDCPDLDYEIDRSAGRLPRNVRVLEFYLAAGKHLDNPAVQRDYISTNYTYVARDLCARGVNVVAQEVCRGNVDGEPTLSLSCNPDVTPELLRRLEASGSRPLLVGQINPQLPFMYGEDALLSEERFDLLLDHPRFAHALFVLPKPPLEDQDYLIGLYASTLVRDGGTIQIGIGSLGDALVYALKLRHEDNAQYQQILQRLNVRGRFGRVIDRWGGTGRFEAGLFASTEMLTDGFRHLIEAGIVKRRVYDDTALQRLLDEGRIGERVTPETLQALIAEGAVRPVLDEADVRYLQYWGVLRGDLELEQGELVLSDGRRLVPDLTRAETRHAVESSCLGDTLQRGCLVHAGFFLGPESLYSWLRDMPSVERRRIDMRAVTRINHLYGNEELDRLQLRDARFMNTAMMVTLSGAVVADGLEDGRVVSGVGGQYNFVAMAHALPQGRSVLQVRSTRRSQGELQSNVVWSYGHTTIARHQRDIVVTEHGIADLRGCTDEENVQALLAVTDTRFQPKLVEQAKRAGKLRDTYQLPDMHRDNLPEAQTKLLQPFKNAGLFPRYPFGTELTDEEQVLGRALRQLRAKVDSTKGGLKAMAAAAAQGAAGDDVAPYIRRMGLDAPKTWRERMYRRVLSAELRNLL